MRSANDAEFSDIQQTSQSTVSLRPVLNNGFTHSTMFHVAVRTPEDSRDWHRLDLIPTAVLIAAMNPSVVADFTCLRSAPAHPPGIV